MAVQTKATNKGGPAARQGFKYQDHVAAHYLLKMFTDHTSVQVECETADDIVYVTQVAASKCFEYVQVKTTEQDKKWSYDEITKLDNKKLDTSLVQKSLLCDIRGGLASFRIVSRRDVYKNLECLKIDLATRGSCPDCKDIGQRLVKKFKATKSKSGRDLNDWAVACVWQVTGAVNDLWATNVNALANRAEQYGYSLYQSQIESIYEQLLEMADAAAVADAVFNSGAKVISRQRLTTWLRQKFADAAKNNKASSKPYLEKPESFLIEFHAFEDVNLSKAFRGFDVQYDFKKWRSAEFARHLVDWLPEFALKPSELVNFQHHNSRALLGQALEKLESSKIERARITAEIMLHAILRSSLTSEPIACKVFYAEQGKLTEFGNAHIVHYTNKRSDELWLGQAKLIEINDRPKIISEIQKTLNDALSTTVLTRQREIVISLREAQHLLPISDELNRALMPNSRAEDLLKVLCFPILLAYDSNVLKQGYVPHYLDDLRAEIEAIYKDLTSALTNSPYEIKIVAIFVPIECVNSLGEQFFKACGAL